MADRGRAGNSNSALAEIDRDNSVPEFVEVTAPAAVTVDTPADAGPPALRLTGLTKRYGDVLAVAGIDLTIPAGQVVALLGPNGAGKSTTVDMLLGLTRPDAGEVRVYGDTPRGAVVKGRIGAMLQDAHLLEDSTVFETVHMIASLHHRPLPVMEALRLAGVADLAQRRCTKLSGGQKQRVRFAIALVSNPDLLVLDEPTAAMDVSARRAFWDSMREFTTRGKTVLFATHYLAEAEEFADRVVFMRSGQISADGSVAEIKALVSNRIIKTCLPGADPQALAALPGVASVDIRADLVELACSDSDAAIRALTARHPEARDIEIRAAGLEEAFLALTRSTPDQ
ncbi:ABC transporter ATP-binding protein [Micromonospora sp. CPCC 206060]|uniref:ABC transporter ATP-binding protein n=1 Tax=Micromonospora sp. CPCC 206060 TaxID=3122406 RepID=UPI002FEF60C5